MTQRIWVGGDATYPNAWNTADNWSPSGVPAAGDSVNIPASTSYPLAAYNASGTALAAFSVDPGCQVAIGSISGAIGSYLQINCTSFSFAGSALAFIDLTTSSVNAVVNATASANSNTFGLYLKGSAIGTVSVSAGSVGVAVLDGETATVTAARAVGGNLTTGPGVTLTGGSALGGSLTVMGAAGTLVCNQGTLWVQGTGAVTTLTVNGGSCYPESSGTVTTLTCNGGATDTTESGVSRTVTNLVLQGGNFSYDPDVLTVSNLGTPSWPVKLSVSNP